MNGANIIIEIGDIFTMNSICYEVIDYFFDDRYGVEDESGNISEMTGMDIILLAD